MSYILFASSGGGLATPVSIANGGTGQTTAEAALSALSSSAFAVSGASTSWGQANLVIPQPPYSADENGAILTDLIDALVAIGVIA
jgi:hypothetical protein